MTPAETLRAAAEYLERHGWCQQVFYDQTGAVCAYTAIRRCTASNPEGVSVASIFAARIGLPSWGVIPSWNDVEGRTAHEVIRTMREVADSLEAGQ